MSNVLKLKTHTVVLLVGPTGCGKSFFARNNLVSEAKKTYGDLLKRAGAWRTCNIQHISSDGIRCEILGHNYNYAGDSLLLQGVSEQAFDLLYKKVEMVTSYPVNAEIVVVDTTGLNKNFRDRIVKIAKDNCYNTCCVVFNYKDNHEYQKYLDASWSGWLINEHIKRLRRETMAELRKKDFDSYFYIKKKNFQDIEIVFEDAEEFAGCHLPFGDHPVIGDVHCDHSALLNLLGEMGFEISEGRIVNAPNKKPIIVGDFIDKGQHLKETVEFLHANRDHFAFLLGNHENFVHKHMTKEIDGNSLLNKEMLDGYFDSIKVFEKDPELFEKFCQLHALCKPFVIGFNFIATHAPCEERHLGKLNPISRKNQRNYRIEFKNADEPVEVYHSRIESKVASFLKEKAARNKPWHIFGHIANKNAMKYKNKIGVDTGAGNGHLLTAATAVGDRVYFKSVPASNPKTEELPNILGKKDASKEVLPDIDLSQLEPKDFSRIKWAASEKVNFISGTMSPSDKDMEKGSLESISSALRYFKDMGVEKVCLQPKYMGSRSEVFLHRDLSLCAAYTRRGYSIGKRLDLAQAFEKLRNRLLPYMEENDFDWLFLDAELMPWHALGKGLIEDQYLPVQNAIGSEIDLLEQTGFEAALNDLLERKKSSGFNEIKNQKSKQEVRDILGHNIASSFESIEGFNWIPLQTQKEYFDVYKRQLEIFASPSENLEFKPFCILKAGKPDGSETLFFDNENSAMWGILTDDECLVADLNDFDNAVEACEKFYQDLIGRDMEGVVVKPDIPYLKGVAPFMKVRSPKYLTIIYGYDYKNEIKYGKLLRQKRIKRKLETSIHEYEYGKRMLEINRNDIAMDNPEYVSLFARMIFEEKKEESFDPRL